MNQALTMRQEYLSWETLLNDRSKGSPKLFFDQLAKREEAFKKLPQKQQEIVLNYKKIWEKITTIFAQPDTEYSIHKDHERIMWFDLVLYGVSTFKMSAKELGFSEADYYNICHPKVFDLRGWDLSKELHQLDDGQAAINEAESCKKVINHMLYPSQHLKR